MEKTYKPGITESIQAQANLKKQRFIGFDGDYCSNKQKALGVSDVSTDTGQFAPVVINGILLVETNGAIAIGEKVTSDNQGRAKLAEATDEINGYALDESQATGQIIRIARGI